eukprot:14970696-Alexandrium_andersonii.AAC.1
MRRAPGRRIGPAGSSTSTAGHSQAGAPGHAAAAGGRRRGRWRAAGSPTRHRCPPGPGGGSRRRQARQ